MASLSLVSVSVAFGGLNALTDVSLDLEGHGIFGLIGPNGAGKSTCINVLSGFQKPDRGCVMLNGLPLEGRLSASGFRHRGITRTFQAGRLFSALSVHDNIAAAAIGMGLSRRHADIEACRVLEMLDLTALSGHRAAILPYTDQRRVAIARAVVCGPSFLLLDEPAAGMSQQEAAGLAQVMRRIATLNGPKLLLVEHNVGLVLSLCERIAVLDGGVVIAVGDPATIANNQRVREAYLGASYAVARPESPEARA